MSASLDPLSIASSGSAKARLVAGGGHASTAPRRMFEALGVELEYMIVRRDTLEVLPICDKLIESQTGARVGGAVFDDITWSNELPLHVVELKTTEPARSAGALVNVFQNHVRRVNDALSP